MLFGKSSMRRRLAVALLSTLLSALSAARGHAAIIDDDDRRTEQQYATEHGLSLQAAQEKFAASGEIRCGPWYGSANLTYRSNIITTAAHLFTNPRNCKKQAELPACRFSVTNRGKTSVYRIESMAAQGFHCPSSLKATDDWAVLTLDRPVEGVTPYSMDLISMTPVTDGDRVLAVGAGGFDFPTDNLRRHSTQYVKTIGSCRVRKVDGHILVAYLASDCDGGRGSSGGAMLKEKNGQQILVAIRKSGPESPELVKGAKRMGRANRKSFDLKSWASYYVTLTSDFRNAIRAAAGE